MKYNKKNIMKTAWELKRNEYKTETFSFCLKEAWKEAKKGGKKMSEKEVKEVKKILKYGDYKKHVEDLFLARTPEIKIRKGEYHADTKEIEVMISVDKNFFSKNKSFRADDYDKERIERFFSTENEKVVFKFEYEKLLEEVGITKAKPVLFAEYTCMEDREENLESAAKRFQMGKITKEEYERTVDLLENYFILG